MNRARLDNAAAVFIAPDVRRTANYYDEAKSARIVREPAMTPYGTYEFVVEDVDGRLIGIGHIREREIFFRGTFD